MKGFLKRMVGGRRSRILDKAKVIYDMIPLNWRYGSPYVEITNLLALSEEWTLDELIHYQNKQLRRLIEHCRLKVPYYSRTFREIGIIPSDIKTVEDLPKLPFLTKEMIKRSPKDFLSKDFSILNRDHDMTSGSSGDPLSFCVDRRTRAMEIALAYRHLHWLGYKKGDPIVEIKEDFFADSSRLFQYYPGTNQLKFSFFRTNNAKIKELVKVIADFRPKYIKAFPSSIQLISRWMNRNKIHIESPKYIITSSENLYDSIKREARMAFGAPIADYYGQNEKVATAFQCESLQGYHMQLEQSIIEFNPVADGEYEIVGTSLCAHGMPFIRYKTGDVAALRNDECNCGRNHPLLSEIRGRRSEFLYSPEREIIAPVAMDYAMYGHDEINQAQIEQTNLDTLNVKITGWDKISENTVKSLIYDIKFYMHSSTIKINVEQVESIPETSRGKQPFIINRLKLEEFL